MRRSRYGDVHLNLFSSCNTMANSDQHINDLSIQKLEASAQEILRLRSENHHLRSCYSQSHFNLYRLKMVFREVEAQAAPYIETKEGAELENSVEEFKDEWKAADRHLRTTLDEDGHLPNGCSVEIDTSLGSPRRRRSKGKSPRIGKPGKEISDSFISANPSEGCINDGSKAAESEEPSPEAETKRLGKNVGFKNGDNGNDNSEKANENPYKTPWEELWDNLADFAGVHDL